MASFFAGPLPDALACGLPHQTDAMNPLLQNLVEMTAHRDHVRVEVSVLSTLQQLHHVDAVRALEIFLLDDVRHVRPRTWMQQEQWICCDLEPWNDPRRAPLAQWPALSQAVLSHASHACAQTPQGEHVLWLLVWTHDQVGTCLEVAQSRAFSAHQLEVLMAIFNVYQNYQSLLAYSERDALTGLLNRRTFDEQLSRHALAPGVAVRDASAYGASNALRAHSAGLAEAAPAETALAEEPVPGGSRAQGSSPGDSAPAEPVQQWLAVIDIDHFKRVNDRFGHLYGDEVLILMANLLRTSFRAYDRVFRFGGEEFVVLLRSATESKALQVLERFRQKVQAYDFPQVGQVTVSIGFASIGAGAPIEIVGRADQALYFAKEHGRNQVCFYDRLLAQGALGSSTRITHEDVELF